MESDDFALTRTVLDFGDFADYDDEYGDAVETSI